MTQLQGRFTRKHLVVVIHYLKSLPKPSKMESIESVSFSFPDSLRIADLLPTAVLPVSLSLLTPTRLFNCRQLLLFLAGDLRFELRPTLLESGMLPLHQPPNVFGDQNHHPNVCLCFHRTSGTPRRNAMRQGSTPSQHRRTNKSDRYLL